MDILAPIIDKIVFTNNFKMKIINPVILWYTI
jgi:hypothetical protein